MGLQGQAGNGQPAAWCRNDLIIGLIKERIAQDDCQKRFLFATEFPRTAFLRG